MIQTHISREPSSTPQEITGPSVKDLNEVYEMLNKIKIADDVPLEDKRSATYSRLAPVQADNMTDIPSLSSKPSSEVLGSPASPVDIQQSQIEQLELEVCRLKAESNELKDRLRTLELSYQSLLIELVAFQRGMAQQGKLMQALLSYLLGNRNGASSVLTPELSPPASTTIPSPTPLPRLESKARHICPQTFTLLQNLDQSLPQLPPSPDSSSSNASFADLSINCYTEHNSILDMIVNSEAEVEMFKRLYRSLDKTSSHM